MMKSSFQPSVRDNGSPKGNPVQAFLKWLRVLLIWGVAGGLSGLVMIVLYSFVGERDHTVLNGPVYENHHFVGQQGFVHLYTKEGWGVTTYGENGLIVNKSPNASAYQVLFIGDSYVKSAQVSDEYKFSEIIEQEWNAQFPETAVQTLNVGLEGLDLRTYLSFSDNLDAQFSPEKVMLLLSDNDFKLMAQQPELLEQLDTATEVPLIRPASDSRVKQLINDVGLRGFFRQIRIQIDGFSQSGQETVEDALASEELEKEAVTRQLEALQSQWGDRLVILYFVGINDLGIDSPETYTDVVLEQMDVLSIPYISLYEPFRSAYLEHEPPIGFNNSLIGHGHWNKSGHIIVANEILAFLETAVFEEIDQ